MDNGREERLGLVGMRERVESLGGMLSIDSAVGRGTRIVAELPLTAGDAHG
jgi:signal transduction histidine kinase